MITVTPGEVRVSSVHVWREGRAVVVEVDATTKYYLAAVPQVVDDTITVWLHRTDDSVNLDPTYARPTEVTVRGMGKGCGRIVDGGLARYVATVVLLPLAGPEKDEDHAAVWRQEAGR